MTERTAGDDVRDALMIKMRGDSQPHTVTSALEARALAKMAAHGLVLEGEGGFVLSPNGHREAALLSSPV